MDSDDDLMIYTAKLSVEGRAAECDVIFHEGQFWLVPSWIEYTQSGWSIPARAIALRTIPHIRMRSHVPYDFQLATLPKYLFDDGPLPAEASAYEILEKPVAARRLAALH